MGNKTSMTALMTAFTRAYMTKISESSFDIYAEKLLKPEEYAAMQRYILQDADFFYRRKICH